MSSIGLALGGEFTHMTVLDAVGEILEESSLRSTDAGFRQRFATLPPSLIAVEYDHRYAALLETLSSMGHSLLLSGQVPEHLCPTLVPPVKRFLEQSKRYGSPAARSLVLQSPGPGLRMGFWIEVDATGDEISPSWFFIGPIPPGADLNNAGLAGFEAVFSISATEQARRLQMLSSTGELALPLYKQDVAA